MPSPAPVHRSNVRIRPASLLVHVGLLLGAAVVLVGLLGVGLWFELGRPTLTRPPAPTGASPPASAPSLSTADRLDSTKVILIVVGGIGGIVALTVAYRRQRYSEAAEDRERVRTFTDRMVKAVEQLGHERAGVRVAGAYALAHLADEWDDGQQMCVDVFCAYIRMPYDPDGDRAKDGEREVRRTMFRIIRDHLRPDPYWGHVKWSACRFSFEGAVIDQCDLSGIHLAEHGHITFHRVRFVDGLHLSHMRLNNGRMWFTGATFAGRYADFSQADLTAGRVTFDGSEFAGGKTTFTGVTHDAGKVTFDGAVHTGGRVDWGPFAALPAPAARPTRSMRRTVGSFIRRGL